MVSIDIRQLHYFRTIVEEGQITRAAKALNMAQPPLSQQLKQLEDELGAKLIIREDKRWEITEAGEMLYRRGLELLHLSEEIKAQIKELGDGIRGTLSIGSSTCITYLPERIKKLHETYPDVYYKIWQGDAQYLEERLDQRKIDLALLLLPVEVRGVEMLRLPKEPFVAVIPATWSEELHRDSISLKEIGTHPLLLLRRMQGTGMYEKIIDKLEENGLSPQVIAECPDIPTLLAFVTSGIGMTLVPRSDIHMAYNNQIKILKIEESFLEKEPVVIWKKDRYLSKAAARFLECFSV